MVSTSRGGLALVAGGERAATGEQEAEGLAAVLRTVPADASTGAQAVARALGEETGAHVTVAARIEGEGWRILAGPRRLADGRPVADVVRDRPAGEASSKVSRGRGRLAMVEAAEGVAVVVHRRIAAPRAVRQAIRQACAWVALAVQRDSAQAGAGDAGAEATVLRAVIEQLLSVRDLDQVLLSIADRTLNLLDADICGVLLREGDQLRMRSCVGHRVVETSRLRMRRGQGVAGLVFLTGEPAKVDNYLDDHTISSDFMALAGQEQTQSALAVPLRLHGEFLGVLEVWRRRPSLFRDQDVRRMVTLADVATIAIDNARLYDEQATAVMQLQEARDALESQVTVLHRSSALQRALLTAVLEGAGLPAIAVTVGSELGCQVSIYGSEGHELARYPLRSLAAALPQSLRTPARAGRITIRLGNGTEAPAWVQPVIADGDKIGCVCLLSGGESPEMMDVVAGQVAMACSLALLRQRAASRARAEALEQVLWDLVQGPVEHRVAARTRAQQMGVSLTGALRVLYGRLENIEDLAAEHGWDTSQTDRVRREVLRTLQHSGHTPGLTLASLRGDWIVATTSIADRHAARELVTGFAAAARAVRSGLRLAWGVSRTHGDTAELPRAFAEAKTALSVAHRLGGGSVFLYEELGIVRLLLGSGDDPDLQSFINEVTGPLIAYDRDNDGALIRTLRAFFDADCSQRAAAERLFIHHKTLRYRLERIKQLTGLDLNRHEDRMRADFALRLLQVNASAEDGSALPPER